MSAKSKTLAPTGRKKIAQGKKRSDDALGHESQNTAGTERAIEGEELPHGGRWMRADEVGVVHLGRQRSPKNRSTDFPTKHLRAANLTKNGIDLSDVLEMDFKSSEREHCQLQPGDIVLSEASGSPSQVGKPAVWKGGKRTSVNIVSEAGVQSKESLVVNRDDFWVSTPDRALNFVQHCFSILKFHGRAVVAIPDSFSLKWSGGGHSPLVVQAGGCPCAVAVATRRLVRHADKGMLFFDRKPAQEKPWTQKLRIYDLRTNLHFTLKENTLNRSDLDDFVACYHSNNRHDRQESERFKSFTYFYCDGLGWKDSVPSEKCKVRSAK